jgi:hypothetical protein
VTQLRLHFAVAGGPRVLPPSYGEYAPGDGDGGEVVVYEPPVYCEDGGDPYDDCGAWPDASDPGTPAPDAMDSGTPDPSDPGAPSDPPSDDPGVGSDPGSGSGSDGSSDGSDGSSDGSDSSRRQRQPHPSTMQVKVRPKRP